MIKIWKINHIMKKKIQMKETNKMMVNKMKMLNKMIKKKTKNKQFPNKRCLRKYLIKHPFCYQDHMMINLRKVNVVTVTARDSLMTQKLERKVLRRKI
jgi:hypothetical protein